MFTSSTRLLHNRHRELRSQFLKASSILYLSGKNRYVKHLSLHPKYGTELIVIIKELKEEVNYLPLGEMINFKKPSKIRIRGAEIIYHFVHGIIKHRERSKDYKKQESDIYLRFLNSATNLC